MATPYAAEHTRTWWADETADRDIHIEAYEGDIDGSFRVDSLFRSAGLTQYRNVQNQSNAYRGDRIGGVQVRGRKSGDELQAERIVNDKFTITVDTTSYVRTVHDFQDDWTAPDFQSEYSAEHGTAHAKAFDQAHVIQLIKASQWIAPTALKASGAFSDGINETLTGFAAETDPEAKADLIVQAHKDLLRQFEERDLGGSLAEFATLVTPEWFNILLDHKKLMNVEFQGGANGENSFSHRRIAWLNGQRIISTPRFPRAAITNHYLGPQFNVTAAEARTGLVTFHPRKTLITVEACPMTVQQHDDKRYFERLLDSYCMYTIGVRRGDATGSLRADA